MQQLSFPQETRPTSLERAHFRDGMIVHADDLDVAMRYPVDMFRMLVRAFFGCGVVCGLEVKRGEKSGSTPAQPIYTDYTVIIQPGVAVDCEGYPLELCRKVEIDLEPRSSSCAKPDRVSILIRRLTTEESPRRPGGCRDEETSNDPCQGVRVREHVQIKVFDSDDSSARVCKHDSLEGGAGNDVVEESWPHTRARMSECLRTCGPCCTGGDSCGGDGWVLLADVEFTMEKDQPTKIADVDPSRRRYVKPIDCLCRDESADGQADATSNSTESALKTRSVRRKTQRTGGEAGQQGPAKPT